MSPSPEMAPSKGYGLPFADQPGGYAFDRVLPRTAGRCNMKIDIERQEKATLDRGINPCLKPNHFHKEPNCENHVPCCWE